MHPIRQSIPHPLTSSAIDGRKIALDSSVCTVITDQADFSQLERQYNSLWKNSHEAAFYQTYSFNLHAWEQIARPNGWSLYCIVVHEQGKLVLAWPLIIIKKGPVKLLRPLGPSSGEPTAPLVDRQSEMVRNLGLAWKMMKKSGCDIVSLPFVDLSSPLNAFLPAARTSLPDYAPFAAMQDHTDWNEFLTVIGWRSFQYLGKKLKRLAQLGHMEFLSIDPMEQPEKSRALVERMLEQKEKWMSSHGKSSPWEHSMQYRNWLSNLVSDPGNVNKYELYVLSLDDSPIAIKLAGYGLSHVYMIFASFDPDPKYSKYSPGLLLDEYCMEQAFLKRLTVEMGPGKEANKLMWSRNQKHETASHKFALSLAGHLLLTSLKGIKTIRSLLRLSA